MRQIKFIFKYYKLTFSPPKTNPPPKPPTPRLEGPLHRHPRSDDSSGTLQIIHPPPILPASINNPALTIVTKATASQCFKSVRGILLSI